MLIKELIDNQQRSFNGMQCVQINGSNIFKGVASVMDVHNIAFVENANDGAW